MPESDALAAARKRRIALKDALSTVETAIAAPLRSASWQGNVERTLTELAAAIDDHVDEVEGAGGLHEHIIMEAPRLAGAVQRLADEHDQLRAEAQRAVTMVTEWVDPADIEVAEAIRETAGTLLTDLRSHRQRGSDLVFEAYDVDIGGY